MTYPLLYLFIQHYLLSTYCVSDTPLATNQTKIPAPVSTEGEIVHKLPMCQRFYGKTYVGSVGDFLLRLQNSEAFDFIEI